MHVLCSTPSLAEVLDPERWLLFSPLLQLVLLFPFITNQNSANPVVLKIRSDVCAKLEREVIMCIYIEIYKYECKLLGAVVGMSLSMTVQNYIGNTC